MQLNEQNVRDIIGAEYVNGVFDSENSERVASAYHEIARINRELFAKIPYKVIFTERDVYASAKEMREQVTKTGEIHIYTGYTGHRFLSHDENNISRAVHDVWAHLVCGCPFTFQGEYNAYLEQRKHYPEWTWNVLFAEIPAQTAAYYHKKDFTYVQRSFEAPERWQRLAEPLARDYSKNSILVSLLSLTYNM